MKCTWMSSLPLTLIAASSLVACGNELGECDRQAAQQLVYGPGGQVATKGQALIHESCGQAAFCHSAGAETTQRKGAPHGMNFDMLPSPRGVSDILDLREDSWEQIDEGMMPPKGWQVGSSLWTYSRARRMDEPRLPNIHSREGKAIVRNWLACGAPVVAESKVPDWAQATGTLDPIWGEIHSKLIVPRCALSSCHGKAGASSSGQLDLADACAAREALLSGKSSTCNTVRVVPGDARSMLIDKITNDAPTCGALRMPTDAPLADYEVEAIRKWIVDGAKADACK